MVHHPVTSNSVCAVGPEYTHSRPEPDTAAVSPVVADSAIFVVTEDGVVYLMGLVTREEARVGTELSRSVGGVQRVVRLFEYQD